MSTGLLWYDNDKNKSMTQKVKDAARRYEQKYQHPANLAHVNSNDFPFIGVVDGIEIRIKYTIMPNHVWIGVKEE